MNRKIITILTSLAFLLTAGLIAVLFLRGEELFQGQSKKQWQTRIVIPRNPETADNDNEYGLNTERMIYEDTMNAKVALDKGETLVTVVTQDIDGDLIDDQIIAYRNFLELDSPVYIMFVKFDNTLGGYRRVWSTPTAVTRPGTASVFILDMIGDRRACVIINGMNSAGEHTLSVFRKKTGEADETEPFDKIAEIRIDGSIVIQETDRSQAYRMGLTNGQSYTIAAYGRDYESFNILDQVEIIYSYNAVNGLYEQTGLTRIPGSQVEQRRVQELLNSGNGEFEKFITGLWYYVSPQGTLDSRQYIYFDPDKRELIFYGDEIQQVFTWQNSSPTRYGLYVASQNISVTTLRRFLDIELESLESIRVKVFEDVRLKIGVSAPWNGSYRRARSTETAAVFPEERGTRAHIDAVYDGSIGRMAFFSDGSYVLSTGGIVQQRGKYAFFALDNQELLELRPQNGTVRETYRVEYSPGGENDAYENLTLVRIRLGTRGIQELHEAAISMTRIQDT
jgi:hypothetical protein